MPSNIEPRQNLSSPPQKISVIIPAYNAGPYIGRAIQSVLNQTRPADEIIVVDDGSTDQTPDEIQKFGTAVRYLHQNNAGASVARNTGIEAANHEWIAFLDGDDEWLAIHLESQTHLLRRNPHLKWTTANYIHCYCQTNRQFLNCHSELSETLLAGKEYLTSYFKAHLNNSDGNTNTMVIQKNALLEAGLFNEHLPRVNDMDMWLRIAYRWPEIGYQVKPIAIYHKHIPESITDKHKNPRLICDLIDQHFQMAEQFHRTDEFQPCAVQMLSWWMFVLLQDRQGQAVREMLKKYRHLFSPHYLKTTWIKTYLPRTGLLYDQCKKTLTRSKSDPHNIPINHYNCQITHALS